MKSLVSLPLIALFLSSCTGEGQIYSDHQELSPNLEWLQEDEREFVVKIEDVSIDYDLSLSYRYAEGYMFDVIRVQVSEISPSGVETIKSYDLKVREADGSYIGEAGFDIWDSEHLIESNKKYPETGDYKYVIKHDMPVDPVNYAMEIGLIVDKSK